MIELLPCPGAYDSAEVVINVAASLCNVDATDVLTYKARDRQDVIWARHLAAYWLRRLSQLSYPRIAETLNLKDHTTVIYAERATESRLAQYDDFSTAVRMAEAEYGRHMKAQALPFRLAARGRARFNTSSSLV